MHIILKEVLTATDIARVKAKLASEEFIDGRATSELSGKKNLQLPVASAAARDAGAIVFECVKVHEAFNSSVLPLALHPPLFGRYEVGMEYPNHIDVALMSGIRTDVALTLFLNEKDGYEGGDLVVDTGAGLRTYRLDAGDAIAYPASMVHRVTPVSRGTRLVAVLWVQSLIRDPGKRQLLYELGLSMRSLTNTIYGPRLSRSYWNLVRLWAETSPNYT